MDRADEVRRMALRADAAEAARIWKAKRAAIEARRELPEVTVWNDRQGRTEAQYQRNELIAVWVVVASAVFVLAVAAVAVFS